MTDRGAAHAAMRPTGLAAGGGWRLGVDADPRDAQHRQAFRRHPGARGRFADAPSRRGPRAARRERRRQVDADQDHDRRLPAGPRRDPARRQARSRSRSAAEAQRHGIAAIYQEPLLFPDLNVAENIFISHQDRGAVTNWRQMFREAEEILAALGVALDVRSPARGLTLAAQQSVEIAKAISLNVRVLIMDEPTASLSAHEVAPALQAGHATCATRASPSSSSATAWRRCSRSPTRSRSSATAG